MYTQEENEKFFNESIAESPAESGLPTAMWVPTTLADCEMLLARLAEDDAEVLKQEALCKAIVENSRRVTAAIKRRREAYEYLYQDAIKKILEDAGLTNHNCTYGAVKVRAVPASFDIVNMVFACEALKEEHPEAIVVERKIAKSMLHNDWKNKVFAMPADEVLNKYGIHVKPGYQKAYLSSNLKGEDSA